MKILTGIDAPLAQFGGSFICCNDWYSNIPPDIEVRFLGMPPHNNTKWWTINDVRMLQIHKTYDPLQFRNYIDSLKKIVFQEIKEFKPDIIHCQHLNYGLSRAFTELRHSIPMIGICHGTDVQAALSNHIFKENLENICSRLDLAIFPNNQMRHDFGKIYQKPMRYEINPLGIPDHFLEEQTIHPNTENRFMANGKLSILYAGRLVDWKGPDIAVRAMSYVNNKDKIHLDVIGDEDQANYLDLMKKIVSNFGIQNSITFRKSVSRDCLQNLFGQYDAIVFPSRAVEAFSLTVIEAQAKGLPVIFSRRGGGIVDTVGEGGIPLHENTAPELARVLDSIADNVGILEEVRLKGYENAKRFTLSRSQERLFDISRMLVDESTG